MTVSVEVPEAPSVTDDALRVAVSPDDGETEETESATVPVNPLRLETVIVSVDGLPNCATSEVGFAAIEKSHTPKFAEAETPFASVAVTTFVPDDCGTTKVVEKVPERLEVVVATTVPAYVIVTVEEGV